MSLFSKTVAVVLLFVALGEMVGLSHEPKFNATVKLRVVDTGIAQANGPQVVNVSLFEWGISTSVVEVQPGPVQFVIDNDGAIDHAFTINGNGIFEETAVFPAGQSRTLSLDLTAGEYDLWCPIPGHRPLGMETGFSVFEDVVSGSIEQALDTNGNRMIDDGEILEAIRLWVSGQPVATTGLTISDQDMLDLIRLWATGAQI